MPVLLTLPTRITHLLNVSHGIGTGFCLGLILFIVLLEMYLLNKDHCNGNVKHWLKVGLVLYFILGLVGGTTAENYFTGSYKQQLSKYSKLHPNKKYNEWLQQ